ncbi:hypothetical protein WJX84_007327 [Apatococcus fuscideae]|uniref:Fungal lipase-type domain-containing protein n=1 Tax=Apatococcus fuscideae TaxID=2026836 RepID=A0AAW1T9S8_9CHLO
MDFKETIHFYSMWSLAHACLCVELACLGEFIRRIIKALLEHKRWSRRRKWGIFIHLTEVVVQTVNSAGFVMGNAWILRHKCGWFDTPVYWSNLIQFTCWNTILLLQWLEAHGADPIPARWYWRRFGTFMVPPTGEHNRTLVMDANPIIHVPKLVVWGVFEVFVIAFAVRSFNESFPVHIVDRQGAHDCRGYNYTCVPSGTSLALTCAILGIWVLYVLVWFHALLRAMRGLQKVPYKIYRMANMSIQVQLHTRTQSNLLFLLTIVLLWYADPSLCSSFAFTIPGFVNLQIMQSCLSTGVAWYYMPTPPRLRHAILQIWLQDFAWTVDDLPGKHKARYAKVQDQQSLRREPLFCFELAIRLFYWSCLVYEIGEGRPVEKFDINMALSLFNVNNYKTIREPVHDSKVLVGWGESAIVLAFRGTSSLANVRSDLQFWQTHFPEGRQSWVPGKSPKVHAGFLDSWVKNSFGARITEKLCSIVRERLASSPQASMRIYVTGHSLGGALATLAAIDIARALHKDLEVNEQALKLSCYTFGAPRSGNHAFAKLYNSHVGDTWHVINDQDLVARGGKLGYMYKRPGQRVLINHTGDIIVRPSYTEVTMQQKPFGGRVGHHYLQSYKASLLAILIGQLGNKQISGGVHGVKRLLEACHVTEMLHGAGPEIEVLERLTRHAQPVRLVKDMITRPDWPQGGELGAELHESEDVKGSQHPAQHPPQPTNPHEITIQMDPSSSHAGVPGDSAWAQPHVKSPSNPQQAPVDSLSRLSASETHHWPHRPNEQDVQTPVDWGEDLSLHEDPSAPVSAYKQRPDGTGPSDGRAAAPSDLPQGSLGDDSSGEHRDRMSEMRQQLWAPSSRSQISDGSERLEPEVNQFDPTNRSFMMQLLHMDETGELARLYQAEEAAKKEAERHHKHHHHRWHLPHLHAKHAQTPSHGDPLGRPSELQRPSSGETWHWRQMARSSSEGRRLHSQSEFLAAHTPAAHSTEGPKMPSTQPTASTESRPHRGLHLPRISLFHLQEDHASRHGPRSEQQIPGPGLENASTSGASGTGHAADAPPVLPPLHVGGRL